MMFVYTNIDANMNLIQIKYYYFNTKIITFIYNYNIYNLRMYLCSPFQKPSLQGNSVKTLLETTRETTDQHVQFPQNNFMTRKRKSRL